MLSNLKLQHLMLDRSILRQQSVKLSLIDIKGSQQLVHLVQLRRESNPLFLHACAVLYIIVEGLGWVEGKAAALPLVEMNVLVVRFIAMVVVWMLVWRGRVGVARVGRFGFGFGIRCARCARDLGA